MTHALVVHEQAGEPPEYAHFVEERIRIHHSFIYIHLSPFREHVLEIRTNPLETRLYSDGHAYPNGVFDGGWHAQPMDPGELHGQPDHEGVYSAELPERFSVYVQYRTPETAEFYQRVHFERSRFYPGHHIDDVFLDDQHVRQGTVRLGPMCFLYRQISYAERSFIYHPIIAWRPASLD